MIYFNVVCNTCGAQDDGGLPDRQSFESHYDHAKKRWVAERLPDAGYCSTCDDIDVEIIEISAENE